MCLIKNNYLIFFLLLFINASATAKLPAVKKGQPLPSDLFVELAKLVNPAVVNISTTQMPKRSRNSRRDPYRRFLEEFLGPQYNQALRPAQSLGTGFIIRKDGLIITNNHVIDKADVIKVQLSENSKHLYEATVIGKDKRTDIALIKIKVKKDLPVIQLGSSKNLEVGEWVAAFGNPFGHGHTMTKGIVSAKGREINEINKFSFIQTDASINPGNSGGPLVNVRGEVIAVNTAIDARAQGIGFAIPIDDVKRILPELEKSGSVKRGYMGVNIKDLDLQTYQALKLKTKVGSLIIQVLEGGPAEKAGIRPYDVVVEFDDNKVNNSKDLMREISDASVNKSYKLKIERDGKISARKITIKEHPGDQSAPVQARRSYKGQKAPFDLGFKVINYSKSIAKEWDLPRLRSAHPIVIEVDGNSPAQLSGLNPGDIILDINRKSTKTAQDVLRHLRKNRLNLMRILRGHSVMLVQISTR